MPSLPGAARVPAIVALAAVLLVTSCTPDDPNDPPGGASPTASPSPTVAPTQGGSVTAGIVGSPATLDPYAEFASDLTYALVRPVYPSLFRLVPDAEGRLLAEPYLAETMQPIDGGVRVQLRAMSWSTGRNITARDVVASIERSTAPSGFASIRRARALSEDVIVLRGPVRDWQTLLATLAFVLPGGKASPRVSGGPYSIKKYTPGLEVVYEPNTEWSGDGPYLDRVTVQFVQGIDLLFALARNDRLDVIVPPSAVNLGDRLDAIGLEHSSDVGYEVVYLDMEGASWSDAEAARIAASIRRGPLKRGLIRGDGRPADHLSANPGVVSGTKLWRSRGRSETDDTIQISGAIGDELTELIQKVGQVHLTKAGYEAELLTMDHETFYGEWERDDPFDVAVRRLAGGPGLRFAPALFRNVDAVPLFFVATYIAWRSGIAGLRANPTHEGPFWNMDQWFLVDGDD